MAQVVDRPIVADYEHEVLVEQTPLLHSRIVWHVRPGLLRWFC